MYAFIAQATTRTAVLALLLAASGCSALAAHPSPAGQAWIIAGDWQRDDASSDDFDSKLAQVLRERQQRLRARHGAGGSRRIGDEQDGGGNSRDPRYFDALEIPQEEMEHFRSRLVEDLRPPRTLHIEQLAGLDAVEMRHDRETASRRYLPGQTISRIDDTGAAQINCGWERQAFVISAQYVHRATRHWRYQVEPATGMLLLRFEVNDPEIGHMNLLSRYRRQPQ
jgi:hypothetical protein